MNVAHFNKKLTTVRGFNDDRVTKISNGEGGGQPMCHVVLLSKNFLIWAVYSIEKACF